MRVPDEIKNCVCFLCVKDREHGHTVVRYGGTAFFIRIPAESSEAADHVYVVTARHCVEKAKEHGLLYLRINTDSGGAELVKADEGWLYPSNHAADVAVLPFDDRPENLELAVIPFDMFTTDEVIRNTRMGIGDQLQIAGLFTQRYGTRRNIPIVRAGIIAAMPEEPLTDDNTGGEYDAYLAEVRSIGGLSGSPVFVFFQAFRRDLSGANLGGSYFLLGLIRGHWDRRKKTEFLDFIEDELDTVNMGIAIVTPIRELASLLSQPEEVKRRRQRER